MTLTTPAALLLAPAVVILGALALMTLRWQRRAQARLVRGSAASLLLGAASPGRRALKAALCIVALGLVAFAAAGPRLGEDGAPVRYRQTDLVVALDVSLSMLARDVPPSRLEIARRSVERLLDELRTDCVGLVVFGGRGALRAPCTLDYEAVRSLVRAAQADSAPLPGSSLTDGVRTALASLRHSGAPRRGILLVSDGEHHDDDLAPVIQEARAAGIPVYTLLVGTPAGGAIPVVDEDGWSELKRDLGGNPVISRAGEEALGRIALETGGVQATASPAATELVGLYEALAGPQAASPAAASGSRTPSQWLGLAAFILLLVEVLVAERPVRTRAVAAAKGRRRSAVTAGAAGGLVLLLLAPACAESLAQEHALNQAGLRAYDEGQFADAVDAFRLASAVRPDLAALRFNAGAALHESAEHQLALQEWQEALASGDETFARDAGFNAGNALFALARYPEAVEAYLQVLRVYPEDFDAKVNLELALQRLAAFPQPEEQRQLPVGTPREIPLGDADPGPQGQQPQPPMNPSLGQQGPDPRESPLPPQGGNVPPQDASTSDLGQTGGTPEPVDPREALREALDRAGEEFSPQEAVSVLTALSLRDPELQQRYNERPREDFRAAGPRPEKDW